MFVVGFLPSQIAPKFTKSAFDLEASFQGYGMVISKPQRLNFSLHAGYLCESASIPGHPQECASHVKLHLSNL